MHTYVHTHSRTHTHTHTHTHVDTPDPPRSSQLAEWTKLLFKCIKPVGEPEFRLNGDIATHTITLRLDMTELDWTSTQASCTREDLRRYVCVGVVFHVLVLKRGVGL